MYTNRLGMLIKADYVMIKMADHELEQALTTVVGRQIGVREINVGVYNSEEDGYVYMALDNNTPEVLEKLREAGYEIRDSRDIDQALRLMFEVTSIDFYFDYDDDTIVIKMPFDEYIKKSHGLE